VTSDVRFGARSRIWRIALVAVLVLGIVLGGRVERSRSADDDADLRLAGPALGPETLDPAQMRDLSSVTLLRQIYRGLVYFDDELNPVPELAESFDISGDGLTYTFKLRPGITFHDGSPITADDVAFSLARAVNPNTVEGDTSLLAGPTFLSDIVGFPEVYSGSTDALRGIDVLSDESISITLVAPSATFLTRLASVPAAIVDRHQVETDSTWWARPIGSGPYRVDRWDPGEQLLLSRFDDFVLGRPKVKTISFRLGSRALQSFNLYQAGEIDVDSVSLFDVDRVTDPNGDYFDQVVRTPQFAFGYIALRTDTAPLDDSKIREALQLAFPRDKFAAITFNGKVDVANGMISNGMLGQDWAGAMPAADLDAARAAIRQSRYGSADKVPPIRIYASGALASEVMRDVASEELGLTIEVFDLEWYDFLDRIENSQVPAYELYWAADYPDPEAILQPLWGTGRTGNYTDYSNADVDKLLAAAATETDPGSRASKYARAEELILADHVVIPTYMDVQYTVIKPNVHGVVITPIGILRLETVTIDQ
jgi:peptide/nickel transport system substrate-binding protein/oligopeptide transport system substrate-binding protein